MQSPSSRTPTPKPDDAYFMSWGSLVGAIIGLIIGLVLHHRLAWMAGLGFGGMIIGAFIDRSRR